MRRLVESSGWTGRFGVGFPAVVSRGVARTAANVSKKWIDTDAAALFAAATGRDRDDVVVANDADVAGLAEVQYGDEALRNGVTVFLTLGTGVGSAVFNDGVLLPNTEFGHLEIRGRDAEERASSSAKERHGWSWAQWAERLGELLDQPANVVLAKH
ncbi:MAG TPA: ROK family protein, partial [Thermomicrobiales bacterium]|nr:ROK family protein [Thermomicrobiales bacterium]